MFNNNQIKADVRLGRDVELKFTNSGKAVASATAAMNIGKREDNMDPIWFRIKGWGYTAEVMAQLRKGDAVRVDGYLTEERWTKDGEQQSALTIVCDSITKTLFKEEGNRQQRPSEPPPYPDDDPDGIPF